MLPLSLSLCPQVLSTIHPSLGRSPVRTSFTIMETMFLPTKGARSSADRCVPPVSFYVRNIRAGLIGRTEKLCNIRDPHSLVSRSNNSVSYESDMSADAERRVRRWLFSRDSIERGRRGCLSQVAFRWRALSEYVANLLSRGLDFPAIPPTWTVTHNRPALS